MSELLKDAYYDDPDFSYPAFWHGREYEHQAEVMAIRRLVGQKKFKSAVDIGGGFGRLTSFLSHIAQTVTLVEPSEVQRLLAQRAVGKSVTIAAGSAAHTGLPDASCDLVVIVRVMHHLPEPEESIAEIFRILKPGGFLVLEFANSQHIKSRLKRGMRLQRTPLAPVKVNDAAAEGEVPFVNHHPQTIYRALAHQGFVIEKKLSVSNMRSQFLKKILSLGALLRIEGSTQRMLSWFHFGPSIFVLAKKP
ncbi:methyltransferase domain-containing protein [Patescibacteria group bacterium]|nr:methyltransferase domain-containing protein [Patescibacteria group bacterium]